MEVHQLRYAVAIADAGTFTSAAQALHVSQSGISAQTARLERELGVELFERGPRRVSLTPAGADLVPRMRAALAALDDIRAAADDQLGLVRGQVRVGAVAGLSWPPFFDALEQLRAEHPGLEVTLAEGRSFELQQQVLDGVLDVAVVAWPGATLREGLASWVAVEEQVAAVVGSGHPWSKRKSVAPKDLAGAEIIGMTRGTGMRAAYDHLMEREGQAAPVAWEVTLPGTVRALAARGLGVGVVTSSRADPPDDLVHLRIRSRHTTSHLGVVWRERPAPRPATRAALRAFSGELAGPG